jgi:hypothetical protein
LRRYLSSKGGRLFVEIFGVDVGCIAILKTAYGDVRSITKLLQPKRLTRAAVFQATIARALLGPFGAVSGLWQIKGLGGNMMPRSALAAWKASHCAQ